MLNLDLVSLRSLMLACEHQSITKAAEVLCLEPSAVSKRLARLEDSTGLTLIERHRRGIQPTPAGRMLVEHARHVLLSMDRIENDLMELKSRDQVRLRLLAPTSAMATPLLNDVATFLREHQTPNLRFTLDESRSQRIVQTVRADSASVGICWGSSDLEGVESRRYRNERLVLVVPTGHPLEQMDDVWFSDTLSFPYVGLAPDTAIHATLQSAANAVAKSIDYQLSVSNFDVLCRVVESALAIGIVPSQLLPRVAGARPLKAIPLKDAWAKRHFVVCFKGYAALPAEGQRLVDHLEASAAQG
jgi:DNA-binding transcriptional LysR family regulator